MLNPSEVWRRAYYEGRECPKRICDNRTVDDAIGVYMGQSLCALGFLLEPYKCEVKPFAACKEIRERLATLYHVSWKWMEEAEARYEGWDGYSRHSLLALAEWAEAQGH